MWLPSFLVLAPLLVLAGCVTAPAARPLPDPPATAARPAAPLAQWWQRFNDPQLTVLVDQALQANADVRRAQAALAQARALRDVRSAGLGPTVGGSASAQRSKSGGGDATNSFQTGFDASWEPDVFGANRSALEAAQAEVRVETAALASVQV